MKKIKSNIPTGKNEKKSLLLLEKLKKSEKRDPEKYLKKAGEAVKAFEKKGFSEHLFESYVIRGNLRMRKGNFKSALDDFRKSQDIAESLNNKNLAAASLNHMGNSYLYMCMLDKALDCYLKALKLYDSIGENGSQGVIYLNIGNINWFQGIYDRAENNYLKGVELSSGKNKKNHAFCFIGLGNIRLKTDRFDEALVYYRKAAEIAESKDFKILAMINNNIGEAYRRKKQYGKALNYLYASYNIINKSKDVLRMAETLCTIGDVFIETGDYAKAGRYIRKSLLFAEKIKSLNLQKDIHLSLSNLYEKSGDIKNSLASLKIHIKLKKKLFEKEKTKKISETELKYEIEKKNLFIEISKIKNKELISINARMNETVEQLKVLKGLIPICAWCKRIRTDSGYWEKLEKYIEDHSMARTVETLCPDCIKNSEV